MIDWPELKPDDEINSALWMQARRAMLSIRLRAGKNIRIRSTPSGTFISAIRRQTVWAHPFKVRVSGSTAEIVPGFLNASIEPEIDGIPLSGTDEDGPPKLEWKKLALAKDKTGYIALEVEFSEKWTIDPHKVKIVQVAFFDSLDDTKQEPEAETKSGAGGVPLLKGRRARWPLARLCQRAGGRLDVFQVTHGDLQARAQPKDQKAETGRVFFW